jgi:hypothetical protein
MLEYVTGQSMISICNMKKMWEMKPSIIFGFYIKYVIFTSLLCIFNPLCRGTIRQYSIRGESVILKNFLMGDTVGGNEFGI